MSIPDHSSHEIDPNGDLTIKVLEYDLTICDDNGKHPVLKTASFKVSRQTVIDKSKSNPLKVMLSGGFLEARSKEIIFKEDTIASVDLWLRCFHQAFDDACYSIPIKEVWHALVFAKKYLIDPLELKEWFDKYWKGVDEKQFKLNDMRQHLYPAYMFDSPIAFAWLTKNLAYKSADHVTEINPTEHRYLHLDGNVVGSINGARGTLRGKLIRGLFDPVSSFLNAKCDCKEKALFAYNMGIGKTGIWPLHEHHKKSIQEILDSKGFVKFECEVATDACVFCQAHCNPAVVHSLRHRISDHFEGLCLDCMKRTKGGSVDDDYWEHDKDKEWSRNCSIAHGQPTWYFSFM
ncbi:hypothetical protein ONS95_009238 [Cadophora gregata]|uniref:uncharacterized protein n=1 Tax=Cadophora gregata TaxID=51156 RepID=UPI0026DD37B0|nr:uncharacterized protein ONS95_009238 [Cadophora gregata]KAK0124265.1 hypothetical protein ONS95_009238 [Cadophora gregata]